MKRIVANVDGVIGNLRELPEFDTIPEESRNVRDLHEATRAQNSDIRKILWQLKKKLKRLRISISLSANFPFQTLVTDATNLTSHTLNGVAGTRCKLTTQSESPVEFDWPNSKRQDSPQIIVGVGDGVAEHAFLVNPDYNITAYNVEFDGAGNLVLAYRPGICIPVQGEPTQLLFIRFVEDVAHKGNIKAVPADIAYGTTIYLHQRMPGE